MSKTVYRMTYEQVKSLGPCSLSKIPDFGTKKYFTPQDAFDAGVPVSDFMWLLDRTGHKWVAVKMALKYAQAVASLNHDPRVQAAIDAGWVCANNPDAARAAAYAADADAVYAVYAAYAAAYAADADADADAARAAADAARAAAYAARAAARAARAAAYAAYAAYAAAYAADAARAAAYAADADAVYAAYAADADADAARVPTWIYIFNEVTRGE